MKILLSLVSDQQILKKRALRLQTKQSLSTNWGFSVGLWVSLKAWYGKKSMTSAFQLPGIQTITSQTAVREHSEARGSRGMAQGYT